MTDFTRRALLYASPALGLGACMSNRSSGRPSAPSALLVDPGRAPDLVFDLWPQGPPGGDAVTITEEVVERDNSFGLRDRAAINITRPTLSLFRAAAPTGAAILLIPGGGYARVVIDKEGYEGARYFNRLGFDVYVLKYRLPDQGWTGGPDTPLQDAQRAVRLIRANAGGRSPDDGKLMVMGFSAGGHLAGSLCQRFDDRVYAPVDAADDRPARPDLGVLVYPVTLMRAPHAHEGSRIRLIGVQPSQAQYAKYDLATSPSPDGPPVFLLHALDDASVPVENSLNLASAYRRAGIPAVIHTFDSGGHGFGLRGIDDKPVGVWPALVNDWARARFTRR